MTTSNLSTTLTAILPSATSTTLGGVLVDSTSSGLLAMSDGHIAVKYSTGLQIDSTGHLHVDSTQFLTTSDAFAEYAQISSLSNYLPVTGGIVYGPTQIDSTGSLHPGNIQFNVDGTGAFLEFNVGVSGVNGGIVFSDGSTQTTAFNSSSSVLTGAISSAVSNYLPLNGGTMDGVLNVIKPSVTGSGINIDGQYLSFNSGVVGGIVFPDGTEQGTAFTYSAVNAIVDPQLANYLPITGGDVQTHLGIFDTSVSGCNVEITTVGGESTIAFNAPDPSALPGKLVFSDNSAQTTAFTPLALLLDGPVSNADSMVSTLSGGNITISTSLNCMIADYTTLQSGTINISFPQPSNDGQVIELVIINGSGTYTASGVALDGVTAASFYLSLGTSAYTFGVFRYVDSTKTWYQVS